MQFFATIILLTMSLLFSSTRALASLSSKRMIRPFSRAPRLFSTSGGQLPADEKVRPFYALGINIARQVGGDIKPVMSAAEVKVFLDGFTDCINEKIEDEGSILETYGQQLNAILGDRIAAIKNAESDKTKEFVDNYMKANPKAIKTKSGLIFNPLVEGTGAHATANSAVEVHYHGTLLNGKVFDSSVSRGETAKFPLKNVILGWQEGIPLLKEGGKGVLVIPPELAYGDRGSPPVIPPAATLMFEVELIKVM